jgi:hypothetical protein
MQKHRMNVHERPERARVHHIHKIARHMEKNVIGQTPLRNRSRVHRSDDEGVRQTPCATCCDEHELMT